MSRVGVVLFPGSNCEHDVVEAVTLSDRVVVLREGAIALDLPVDLPRPRPPAAAEVAELEAAILGRLQD